VSVATVFIYDRHYAKNVVAIDIASFVEDQKKRYVDGEMSKEELDAQFEHLKKVLDDIPENYLVIQGAAVVRNVEFIDIGKQ
jgi:hypothetical protein